MLGPSVSYSGGWYSTLSGIEDGLAEDHMRGGNELALARSLQHLKAVVWLVWRGAEMYALVCARVPAVHQGGAHTPGRTSGGSSSPMAVDLFCARAG
eukprot:5966029-Pleurochrysis_carterae.AAC.1